MTHHPNRIPESSYAFRTRLGWFAVACRGELLTRLSFGNRYSAECFGSTDQTGREFLSHPWNSSLVERLKAYAEGQPDDFLDLAVEPPTTDFFVRVAECCRHVPYGETMSYAELARRAGSPLAARAVGAAMASNRIAIVVPCHRVVRAGGALGGFSAPGGLKTKQRLLDLEAQNRSEFRLVPQKPALRG